MHVKRAARRHGDDREVQVGRGRGRSQGGASSGRRRAPELTGTVVLTGSGAFVDTPEGRFRFTERGLRGAMGGDIVSVSLRRGERGQLRAQVESTLERATDILVGTYGTAGPLGVVRPLDPRVKLDFFVLPTDDSPARAGAGEGDVVRARIVGYPTRHESGVVRIEERLGGPDAPDLPIRCVMARYDLEGGYPAAALEEARARRADVEDALADPLRIDIRERFALTIDPVDARDFDDAISIERTASGGWLLGVHIADVSHYVPWGGHVDLEARRRGTSVYLADRVLPMVPEELSCDVCSLVPDEDRLAVTVDIELDARGRVKGFKPYPSAIRSRVRTDYEAVEELLPTCSDEGGDVGRDSGGAHEAARGRADVAAERAAREGVDLAAFLADADGLARARRALRARRGAVDFETSEVHVLLDRDGAPERIVTRARTAATSLVEEAMLLANECVARWLVDRGLEAAFRVHAEPSPDELAAAVRVLLDAGAIDAPCALGLEAAEPAALQGAVDAAHGTPAAPLVNALLLRAQQRAVYRPCNLGHYALAAPAYCHFTSPIRRYPDLVVQRVVKQRLAEERLGRRAAADASRGPESTAALIGRGPESLPAILAPICRQASDSERIADAAAHASQKAMVCRYYAGRVGERVSGAVSWIDSMGAFVRLDETGAEGLVRMAALGDEWWDLDEERLMLVSSATGREIRLGTRVVVEIAGSDPMRGHLDFRLIHAAPALH